MVLKPASDIGLSTVYEPDDRTPVVDIVFVHGLQGHPKKTWSGPSQRLPPRTFTEKSHGKRWNIFGKGQNENKSSSRKEAGEAFVSSREPASTVFWPQDLLPTDCPGARILTWGYNTIITRAYAPSNQNDIFAHARDLLFALQREHVKDRKLVFVAHSLGGIVVKDVLRRSHESTEPSFKRIVESTFAVVFLGTPHGGSADFATLGDVVRRIVGTILRMGSNPTILRALGVDSPELELGRESFITLWRLYDFIVKTFQEALPLTGVNLGVLNEKVVPKQSSSLGDPREHAETIDANHMDICRFYGADDPRYRQVGGELKAILERIQAGTQAKVQQRLDIQEADVQGKDKYPRTPSFY